MTSTNSVSRTHNTITPTSTANSPGTSNHPANVTNTTIGAAPRYTSTLSEEDAVGQARLLKALADSTRLRILNLLSQYEGKVCVFEIVESISLEQPTVSHHLRVLRDAGLVDFRKKGLWAYYYVQHDALTHAQDLINKLTY
jgi:ArsR family transcriptional regulator, arsenate/arsenite/antimonite-responsive transcriptional repressor